MKIFMTRRTKSAIVLLFFTIAFIHASIWAAITPLWQIPDEAAHYEYVRLLVKLGRMPTKEDEDPAIQADILRSMWENNYWEYLGYKRPDHPPTSFLAGGWTSGGNIPETGVVGDSYIGAFSNLNNTQPLYYLALAPVQQAILDLSIDEQLRILRLASRFIFALAVAFVILTAFNLFNDNLVPIIGVGIVTSLQPMFAYIGSGVNNDVGVACLGALLAWQVSATWRYGWSPGKLAAISLIAIAAVFTKRTAIFILVWVPIIASGWWILRINKKARRQVLTISTSLVTCIAVIFGVLYLIPGPLSSNWTSPTSWQPTWSTTYAHTGNRSFTLRLISGEAQNIKVSVNRPFGLADRKLVVFTTWVYAPNNASGSIGIKDNTGQITEQQFSNVGEWQLITTSLPISVNTSSLVFNAQGLSTLPVYIDDVHAEIASEPIIPLSLPNPSAEEATPVLGQIILSIARMLGVYGQAASMLRDYRANLAALPLKLDLTLTFLNTSFWGKFGIFARATNPSLPNEWNTFLGFSALFAMLVAIVQVITRRDDVRMHTLIGLFIIGIGLLLIQTLAPMLSFAASNVWLPQGRYIFAGIGLVSCILIYGWLGWIPNKWQWLGIPIITTIFTAVVVITLERCMTFFQ